MAAEELTFLRDQVQRLNDVLSEYQQKYPPLVLSKASTSTLEEPPPPWTTDRKLILPLLVEYDANIESLREQVETYKQEQKELRSQVAKLVAENKRLTRELKEAVQTQLEQVDVEDLKPTLGDDQVMHNLQYQLQMALQEKDTAMEMWQASVQEVERLELQVQNQQFNPRLHSLEQQASQIKAQYIQTVSDLNNEISSLQEQLRKSRTEHKAAQIQVTDLRQTLEEMKRQFMVKEQERSALVGREEVSDSRVDVLEKRAADLEAQLLEKENEMEKIKNDKTSLAQKVMDLQKKSTESEQREYEAVLQVRDSVQMVETAMLDKDQALVREQQKTEEVERLQEAITKLLEEAGIRTRQEVDHVKKQCNQNISRLMEDIHALEMENSEKQAQIDRCLREKKAVESELEKLYQEGLVQGTKDSSTYEELNRRACQAERTRDEAVHKLESMENSQKRLEMSHKKDKTKAESELMQLQDRVTAINQELDSVNNDRLNLVSQVDELKKKTQQLQQERDSSQRNYSKEMACMEQDMKLKDREYEARLQSIEDSHRHAMMEVRQLLTAQQRMSAKWKEECQTITQKFETKVSDLRSEVSRHKKRNEELLRLLSESREKTSQVEQMLGEYSRNVKRMEERVRDAEQRATDYSVQLTHQLRKDRNMLSQSKRLERSLRDTLHGSDRTPDPIGLSDLSVNGHQDVRDTGR